MATTRATITRALRKSIKAGYNPVPGGKVTDVSVKLQTNTASYITFFVTRTKDGKAVSVIVGLNDVLFDHGFAIAIWGEDKTPSPDPMALPAFKHHLQQLAILNSVDGRIAYIGSTM